MSTGTITVIFGTIKTNLGMGPSLSSDQQFPSSRLMAMDYLWQLIQNLIIRGNGITKTGIAFVQFP